MKKFIYLFLIFISTFCFKPLFAEDLQELYKSASSSYIYAFPAVLMDVTRELMTNVASPMPNGRAPINQFSHAKKLATADERDIVRPNNDTLYSIAWLDLSYEPLIYSIPDTKDRFYVTPLLDIWTDVFESIGKRNTEAKPKNYIIVGPNWSGPIPENMPVIKAPTNIVWITGRMLVNGELDYEKVYELQKDFKLTPLSKWGSNYEPPRDLPTNPEIDMETTPLNQVLEMDVETFFKRFSNLLKNNPPHKIDIEILADLKTLGLEVGSDFDINHFTNLEKKELEKAIKHSAQLIVAHKTKIGRLQNGWIFLINAGDYGDAYLDRASVAHFGIGANIPEDSIYPSAITDKDKKKLNGENNYVVHFEANQIPPVNGFWSITMYGADSYLVANPINRYSLGDRSNLQFNNDGSLDIYLQKEPPSKNLESNWLPAPKGEFNLSMRLYWPKPEALTGAWNPPAIFNSFAKN